MSWSLWFGGLFLAEFPDKTSLTAMALVSRYRALVVFLGSALALLAQTIVAITAGRLLALIPKGIVSALEVGLFGLFAIWLWHEAGQAEGANTVQAVVSHRTPWADLGRVFGLVFVAEFLDLTQLATMALVAAHPDHLLLIGMVAASALILANATVIGLGRIILRFVSPALIQRLAALVFAVIAVVMGISQWAPSLW